MKIVFICEGNMMRSQMAEAFFSKYAKLHTVSSAGAVAEDKNHISSRAAAVLSEVDIDSSAMSPTQVTPAMVEVADRVIYFPSEFMPDYVKNSHHAELWDVVDPHYHQDQGMNLVRQVRDDIDQKVQKLVQEIR